MHRVDDHESTQGAKREPKFLTLGRPLDPAKPYLHPVRLTISDCDTYANVVPDSHAVIVCPAGFFAIVSS